MSDLIKPELNWKDIPQFPRAHYEVDIPWDYLERHIAHQMERGYGSLDLNPDYQRAHVWTREQQVKYVEYILEGGEVGKNLTFNHTEWDSLIEDGVYTIVDGKQRLEAARAFLRGDFRIFMKIDPTGEGWFVSEVKGHFRISNHAFRWRVCTLRTKADLLRLYLSINAGGTPHSPEEISRVQAMLAAEIACPTDPPPPRKAVPLPPVQHVLTASSKKTRKRR